jgi:HD-GYP domain-containing protein (c-di-GMP phosphodiesterase class II)
MIADRPYRAGMPPAAAGDELLRSAGTQFDPDVVQAFLSTLEALPALPSSRSAAAA